MTDDEVHALVVIYREREKALADLVGEFLGATMADDLLAADGGTREERQAAVTARSKLANQLQMWLLTDTQGAVRRFCDEVVLVEAAGTVPT